MSKVNLPTIYVTYIEPAGPLLRIWGQIEVTTPLAIERALRNMTPQFNQGVCIPAKETLRIDSIISAKFKDGLYYRAVVTSLDFLHNGVFEVRFMDYGNKDFVDIMNTRTITQPGLAAIPSQAQCFVLSGVTHMNQCWDETTVMIINNEFRYFTLQYVQVGQYGTERFIRLLRENEDISITLMSKNLAAPINPQLQQIYLENLTKRVAMMPMFTPMNRPVLSIDIDKQQLNRPVMAPMNIEKPSSEPVILVYKSFTLKPYSTHAVYVSYVCDGPCQFSIQLQSMEDRLAKLMTEINSMPLCPLEENPLPGRVCMARCEEDDHICRAVVTSNVDNKYKVFFVDFGNTEVVAIENLYEIPFKLIVPKVMASRYALSGIERSTVTMEMKFAFKNFVSDKLLTMRTIPPESRSSLPTCDLWDEDNISVLEVIKRAAMLAYPEPLILNRGFNQDVRVSFVTSCKQFYVQLKSKEAELQKLMLDLQQACTANAKSLPLDVIKPGLPCCALFDVDNQWYRAQIVSASGMTVKVRYIDFGNENLVSLNNLIQLQSSHILALRPQAIECCLNGYQNMEPDQERDNFLEEIILEQEFCMKVVEMMGTRVLVDLIDSAKYNVASLLLDKIAMAKSQVSPLLIQDGNKIDHRKNSNSFLGPSSPKECNFKQDRRPSREQNVRSWGDEKPTRNDNWRTNKPLRNENRNNFEDTRHDFGKNRGGKPQFNKSDSDRSDDDRKKDNRRDFNKNDGNKFFGRGDSNRSFGRNEGNRDFSHGENRRDFNRNDNNRDFNRNEVKRDFGRSEGRNFGKNDSNRDYNKNKDNKPSYNREKSWTSDASKRSGKSGFHSDSGTEGSEKSWKKSPRQNNTSDSKPRFQKQFDNKNRFNKSPTSYKDKFNPKLTQNNFETSFDLAPSDATFETVNLTGQTKAVSISWFHNPSYFYCQLNEYQDEFRTMMEEIQKVYPKRKPADVKAGAPVISLFSEDGVLYRARVLQAQASQYRVHYIDFGNVCTVDKVWPIDKKFMKLPAQTFCCGLVGLNPPNDKWPEPDVYCPFFDKDSFICTFNSKTVDNKYNVDLVSENVNVSQALVTSGLAKTGQSAAAEIDINLLVGQQIKVDVVDINNLSDFKIEIQSGISLPCTMHNLTLATETFEDKLKELNNTHLIVYVDSVIDNKLEVTLYDLQGQKIEILKPDEGAFESILPLCSLPVFYSTLRGYVLWATDNSIFIQPSGFEDTVGQLLDQLYQHYTNEESETISEAVEESVYAVHSSDGNWYRGSVVTIENENISVLYLDYGNTEVVTVGELRTLAPKFMNLHALSLEVFVKETPQNYLDKEVIVTLTITEQGWEGEVELQGLQEEQQGLAAVEEVVADIQEDTVEDSKICEVVVADEINELNQNRIAVVISHIDSPNEFYLQQHSALDNIDSLQAKLQEQINNLQELENAAAGVLCAAPYSLDSQWYRAQVLDADNDITTVRFVDFGNTDVLDNHSTHVKTLTSEFLALEQHARKCSLNIKPAEEEWGLTASQRFEVLTSEDEVLTAEITHQDEKTTFVELFVKNKNIAEVLIQEGLATKLEFETESQLTGFVSHLNSPSEFWIQLESSVADLEWIADQLSAANTFPELEDLAPGSLCAAIFSEDEQWYRARILSNTVAGIEVLFIDYGNSCTCSSLRELPEDLILLPALAQKCTLKKPPGLEQWTSQAMEKFKEISAEGVTIFNIHKLTTGETAEVELLLNDQDVSLQLLPSIQNCIVTKFESFESIWILKSDDKESIECKLEPLQGISWNSESENKFKELLNEGKTSFQVEYLNDSVIRLYIEFHDIRYDLGGNKIITVSSPKKNYMNLCVSETVNEIFDNVMDDIEKNSASDVEVEIDIKKIESIGAISSNDQETNVDTEITQKTDTVCTVNNQESNAEKEVAEIDDEKDVAEIGDEKDVAEIGDEKDVAEIGDEKDVAEIGDEKDVAEIGDEKEITEIIEEKSKDEDCKNEVLDEKLMDNNSCVEKSKDEDCNKEDFDEKLTDNSSVEKSKDEDCKKEDLNEKLTDNKSVENSKDEDCNKEDFDETLMDNNSSVEESKDKDCIKEDLDETLMDNNSSVEESKDKDCIKEDLDETLMDNNSSVEESKDKDCNKEDLDATLMDNDSSHEKIADLGDAEKKIGCDELKVISTDQKEKNGLEIKSDPTIETKNIDISKCAEKISVEVPVENKNEKVTSDATDNSEIEIQDLLVHIIEKTLLETESSKTVDNLSCIKLGMTDVEKSNDYNHTSDVIEKKNEVKIRQKFCFDDKIVPGALSTSVKLNIEDTEDIQDIENLSDNIPFFTGSTDDSE